VAVALPVEKVMVGTDAYPEPRLAMVNEATLSVAVAVAFVPPVGAAVMWTVGGWVYPDPGVVVLIELTPMKVPVAPPLFATALVPPVGGVVSVAVGLVVYPEPPLVTLSGETTGKPRPTVAVAPVPPPLVKLTVGALV
jgi:hypothetical protein